MAASSPASEAHSRARLATVFVVGAVVGVLVFAAAAAGFGYTFKSSTTGQVTIGSIWVNYTYTTPTPTGDSQPLNEIFQSLVSGGTAGDELGVIMSPYDNSTMNCTLWSLAVFAPFKLVSVIVTALPGPNETVHEPLPVVLPAAVHGTSHWANLAVEIGLPESPGTYALVMSGTGSCD